MRDLSAAPAYSRFDDWHEVTCRTYSLAQCHTAASSSFQGRIGERTFGSLSISDVSSFSTDHPLEIVRGHAEIRRDPREDLMLYLVCQGEIGISQHGRSSKSAVGDFFLYDQSEPFRLMLGDRARGIVLKLPRGEMASRLPLSRELAARRIDGASQLGILARSMISQIASFDGETDLAIANRIGASVLDILATTLETQLVDHLSLDERRLQQIKRYMLANLEDSALTVENIASHNNLAPRTLYRLFSLESTTPIRWLWQQRLSASYDALVEGRVQSVTDAALGHGFAEVSHFSRSFKSRFGRAPHSLLRRSR